MVSLGFFELVGDSDRPYSRPSVPDEGSPPAPVSAAVVQPGATRGPSLAERPYLRPSRSLAEEWHQQRKTTASDRLPAQTQALCSSCRTSEAFPVAALARTPRIQREALLLWASAGDDADDRCHKVCVDQDPRRNDFADGFRRPYEDASTADAGLRL
jgi:hypothetical protein